MFDLKIGKVDVYNTLADCGAMLHNCWWSCLRAVQILAAEPGL